MALIFWIFILIVFYTYVGYGILLFFLVKVKEIFKHEKASKFTQGNKNHILPPVTLLIAAYNEEDIIEEKMKNCYNIDYPANKFEIFWITDGSNDSTNALVDKYVKSSSGDSKLPKVSLSFSTERKGKTAAINRAIPLIDSQIIVLTDANTNLNREVILEIVNKFQNPQVGCVAGEKRVNTNNSVNAAGSEGIYWKYESFLKKYDSRLNSTVGAAGELYAIRKNLFEPMPEDTLLDDFISSLHIAM
ncbi:MAG: glycosyltransferase family 2 protein, partial [Bacteroidales bacterium]